jgi:hypothetical protein
MVRLTDQFFPIVAFQPLGDCGPDEVDQAENGYREAFRRHTKFISISDARRSANHAPQRKLWADLTQRLHGLAERWTVATVIILDSAALRAALTAVNWIAKPPIPQVVVKNPEEAIEAAHQLAMQHQIALPQRIEGEVLKWLAEGIALHDAQKQAEKG